MESRHASSACRQFLRKLWTFLDKQHIFGSSHPTSPQFFMPIHNKAIFEENHKFWTLLFAFEAFDFVDNFLSFKFACGQK